MSDPWRTIYNPVTREQATFIQTAEETGGTFAVLELTLAPGGAVKPHAHGVRERFECLAGTPTVRVDGKAIMLTSGQEATAQPGMLHELRNDSDAPATVRVTVTPHGDIEAGLRTVFGLARDGRIPENGPPKDLLVFALLARRGGLYMPPLPRWLYWPLMGGLATIGRMTGAEKVIARYSTRPN
jgi:quercetin dioxygenase-like cupin family protein